MVIVLAVPVARDPVVDPVTEPAHVEVDRVATAIVVAVPAARDPVVDPVTEPAHVEADRVATRIVPAVPVGLDPVAAPAADSVTEPAHVAAFQRARAAGRGTHEAVAVVMALVVMARVAVVMARVVAVMAWVAAVMARVAAVMARVAAVMARVVMVLVAARRLLAGPPVPRAGVGSIVRQGCHARRRASWLDPTSERRAVVAAPGTTIAPVAVARAGLGRLARDR